ncbi:hypothetical protein BU23DRAFT_569363 [Bimuria novae-zelandiae CBS 107.79]|uniref:Uncharacterized protein n=1 Tax=Bimuria novae-zelandiae CBS 107.79 TaxID=1447943 RepID=A0A6A5V520_9PLEO|nr:hypothetical protein BU23DRAFT_569363 [Bimuria novae-zelandiae CBS 107.79]
MACCWMANIGIRPTFTPPQSTPRKTVNNNALTSGASAIAAVGDCQNPSDKSLATSDPPTRKSEPEADGSLNRASSTAVKGDDFSNIYATSVGDILYDGSNLKRLFHALGSTYEEMDASNKRMKKAMDAIRCETSELKTAKDRLVDENARLQRPLESEKKQIDKLQQDHRTVSESLVPAETKAKEADLRAVSKFAHDRRQYEDRVEVWKNKTKKARAERDE